MWDFEMALISKNTCNLAVWCLSVQGFDQKHFQGLVQKVVDAIVLALDTPFKSPTIQIEALTVCHRV